MGRWIWVIKGFGLHHYEARILGDQNDEEVKGTEQIL
jgi:hypothetical protein